MMPKTKPKVSKVIVKKNKATDKYIKFFIGVPFKMYGLNNNTGVGYSQQDNNFKRLAKKITSIEPGEAIKKASKIASAMSGIKNGKTGGERITNAILPFL